MSGRAFPRPRSFAPQGSEHLASAGELTYIDAMQEMKHFFRRFRREFYWRVPSEPVRWRNPQAYRFFAELMARGYHPEGHIDVVPKFRLIYIANPKAASSTIKKSLSSLVDRNLTTLSAVHRRKQSGLQSPSAVGIETFYRLATAPDTLRFSFVRNPFERLVSCWEDKYRGRPLVRGDPFVNVYLDFRKQADLRLPHGPDAVLPFADFVEMAAATCEMRIDPHWNLQDEILTMPGIALDMIGQMENFDRDFARVIAHVGVPGAMRDTRAINASKRSRCRDYYDDALASRIRRAYEKDFERFGYSSVLPD
jgi:hypothetical protein